MKEFDIAVIGAGAAGMTAAIYGLRAKKSVVLFERLITGGQMLNTTKIENYPGLESVSGKDLAATLKGQVLKFGGEIVDAEVAEIKEAPAGFEIITDDEPVLARSVILANGSKERELGLDNEKELIGKGVSYCATCDGALFKDKKVAVYGGGNTAAYSVLYLSKICSKVYWIFRKPEPRAEKHIVEKLETLENVEIRPKTVIRGLMAGENGELTSLGLEAAVAPGEKVLTDIRPLEVDGLFVTIGREADNERFRELVELDENGYIKSNENCETSRAGIFCAGDTRAKKLHQIVTATADGAVAATAAVEYLNKKS